MKKAFIVFLTASFLFALTLARPARADSIGTVVVAAVVAVVALGAVSAATGSQRDIAKIETDKHLPLEEIRARTMLEAPCRFGEKGGSTYSSSEGDSKGEARIDSVIAEGAPCQQKYHPLAAQVSAQPVTGSGYGRPSCQRGDWELRQTPFGPRWTCSSTGEML